MTSLMVANKESIVHPAKKPETPEEKLARQNARNAKLTAYNLDIKQSIVHAKPEFIAFVEHGAFEGLRCKSIKEIPELGGFYIGTNDNRDYIMDRYENKHQPKQYALNNDEKDLRQWIRLKVSDNNVYYDAVKNKFYYCNIISSKKVMLIDLEIYDKLFEKIARPLPAKVMSPMEAVQKYGKARRNHKRRYFKAA